MVVIPQVVTTDRATGAQVIDGSLKFDAAKSNHITRTPGSAGNRKTFTVSTWIKGGDYSSEKSIFGARSDANNRSLIFFSSNNIYFQSRTSGSLNVNLSTSAIFRDPNGWFHLVVSIQSNDQKIYINGEQRASNTVDLSSVDTFINSTSKHAIGAQPGDVYGPIDASLSQFYLIDGQALGPENFGFTDPLTNTWKPKKYEGTFGTNGFYLPMDGNSPIGQDQSGNGNDWTPVNFGGSVTLDSPLVTGARPILNTTQGGTQAGVGVFGSKQNVGYAVTVYNSGGGNKYYLDGVEAPTLTGLIRGATYTFDQSDSTNSTHPLVFGTTAEGNNFNGATATSASAGSAGAATTITIPYDGPNTIYYHCSAHSGMGADITGITTNEKLADQYASNCVLALPLVGANNDVSASIACTSTTKTITASNTSHPNTKSNFYSGSIYFDDTADEYISFPGVTFSGEFCVEFWYYPDALATANGTVSVPLSGDTLDQFQVGHTSTNGIEFYYDGSLRAHSGAIGLDKWYHIALTRDSSNVLKLYVDGIQKGNTPTVSTSEAVTTFYLGVQYRSGNADYHRTNGYIQDFRIYNDTVKYSSNFVVPATSPDILPDTPSGVAGGSKLTKITDGAVSFDGTDDYLSVADSSDLEFGDSDFTIEGYYYISSLSAVRSLYAKRANSSSYGTSWYVNTDGSINIALSTNGSGWALDSASSAGVVGANKWHHLAVTRSGTSVKQFVDGIEVDSGTLSGTIHDNSSAVTIGVSGEDASFDFSGFMSNVRVIKGTALYTSRFTPPTAPLTNVTNTKLLCCQSNTSATEGAVKPGTITANGDAAATNFNPFNTDIHTVRGQESSYTTWNPLDIQGLDAGDLKDGNLSITHSAADWLAVRANKFVSSGKWYYEVKVGNNQYTSFGVGSVDYKIASNGNEWLNVANVYGFYPYNGKVYDAATGRAYATADTSAAGNVYGIAIDMDNKSLRFYEDGRDLGVAFDSTTATNFVNKESVAPMAWLYNQSGIDEYNFGQKPFKYAPPDGFQPLNAANTRPVKVISRPDQYVGIVTYTGNGSDGHSITGFGHSPDLLLVKARNQTYDWMLHDTVRGKNINLRTNLTNDDNTDATNVTSFDSDGFTTSSGSGYMNGNTVPFVAYSWKAGGPEFGGQSADQFWKDGVQYASAAAAGLDAGVVTPSAASVGTKQGFSILKYNGTAGQSCSHGLTQAPEFIIEKEIGQTSAWTVQTTVIDGSLDYLYLNTTAGANDYSIDAPTSTVFDIGRSNECVAYLWHSVPGFSKFGSFTIANSSSEYVHLGFKPAIIWIKRTGKGSTTNLTTYGSWYVNNSEMSPINPASYEEVLWLNRNYAEGKRGEGSTAGTYLNVDFLSDGFRMRGSANAEIGQPNDINIYCAWAEAPSIDLFGGGANAR